MDDVFDVEVIMRDRFYNSIKFDNKDSKLKLKMINIRNPAEEFSIKVGDRFKNVGIFRMEVVYDGITINSDNIRFKVQAASAS